MTIFTCYGCGELLTHCTCPGSAGVWPQRFYGAFPGEMPIIADEILDESGVEDWRRYHVPSGPLGSAEAGLSVSPRA